jgi:hypothetical protein
MRAVAAIFCLSLLMLPAWAVLGQLQDSVQSDQRMLQGRLSTVEAQGYTIQQITRSDGGVLKEFVSPDGKVFGFTWQGPTMPNLAQLLGSHFAEFQEAAKSAHRHGPLAVHVGQLVVETSGHLRSFRVRAYMTGLLPRDLSPEAVR